MANLVSYSLDVCRRFGRSSRAQKKHILFIVIASAIFRFAQIWFPFRWLSSWLGIQIGKVELCTLVTPQQVRRALKTGSLIESVCDRMPWQARCLVKASILKFYLDRYEIPYVLYLGLAKGKENTDQPFYGHAWITVGGYVAVGREGHRAFTVISTYVASSLVE